MNKFIKAIADLDIASIKGLVQDDPKWISWSEKSGKNALHYLCEVNVGNDKRKANRSLQILKLLLNSGMDINSVHKIPEKHGYFPGKPLWYAYTRGRNKKLYTYLLKNGADPNHCMFAIAWYDDPKSAALFRKHGAAITDMSGKDTPFLAAWYWKKFNMAKWLLANGADVNITDSHGNTALLYAVKKKYDHAHIKLLLKFGANADKKNKDGLSARTLAEKNRQRNILKLFDKR